LNDIVGGRAFVGLSNSVAVPMAGRLRWAHSLAHSLKFDIYLSGCVNSHSLDSRSLRLALFSPSHLTTTTMTTVSPFARSSAFEEPRLSGREQTVRPTSFIFN
jgi:hypothetical protein